MKKSRLSKCIYVCPECGNHIALYAPNDKSFPSQFTCEDCGDTREMISTGETIEVESIDEII